MRHYKVKGLPHTVYDEYSELPPDIAKKITSDIEGSSVGEWIEAHDGCYMEVLRSGEMKKPKGKNRIIKYIGTCTGTYLTSGRWIHLEGRIYTLSVVRTLELQLERT